MNFKLVLSVLLTASTISVTSSVFANEYQTFADLDYLSFETKSNYFNSDASGYSLNVNHFLDNKQTIGPLAEFEYINKVSNVFAAYVDIEDYSAYTIGGNYFADKFLIGANFQDNGTYNSKGLNLGYLINDDFLVQIEAFKADSLETTYNLSASYNHQLEGNDYLGFTYSTDDEFDYQTISSTYFTQLDGGHYFKLGASYYDSDSDNSWGVDASYYVSEMTSFSLGSAKYNDYTIATNHFFNDNFAINASYSTNDEDGFEDKFWQIGLSAQF